MKKILLLLLLLINLSVDAQVDYNNYISKTKKDIIRQFKEENFKYKFEQKMYVQVDSVGLWHLDEDHYTWLVYYNDITGLFTFNNISNRCDQYYLLHRNLSSYWDYFDYYNQVFDKSNRELVWVDKYHSYYVEFSIRALSSKQFYIFVERKNYKK